ncbi:N-acetyltransferase [Massilia sp. TS11]|uniref:GNAT family N-acetyltransferase n=1 Tax=Massilia sp. TS11 TaxID=2908003 RepID=UPI001EDACC96|nr:GNAT family N-acetyltransferase [Massilia sp. TS11]MCG2585072.1 GNAT family N-acetyltransferase [Massilia sp. TS11]
MELTWRLATGDDAAFLAALFASTRPELALLPPALSAPLLAQQQSAQGQDWARRFPDAEHRILQAGGVAVGRLWLARQADGWRVVDLAILPDWRRRGLARQAMLDVLRAAGQQPVRLAVVHENLAAQRLYASLGFREVGRDPVRAELVWTGFTTHTAPGLPHNPGFQSLSS